MAGWIRNPEKPAERYAPLPLRAAVSLAGVVDLRLAWARRLSDGVVEEFMGGPPERVPERYAAGSPAELLPLGVRQVLVHGTADANVPLVVSEAYQAAARARGDDVRLVTLPGAGHFAVIDPRTAEWRAVVAAVLDALA